MYIVLEIQKSDQIATLVTTHTDRNQAVSDYYRVLSAAAVSSVPMHSAVLMEDTGSCIASDSFIHQTEEPEEGSAE